MAAVVHFLSLVRISNGQVGVRGSYTCGYEESMIMWSDTGDKGFGTVSFTSYTPSPENMLHKDKPAIRV